MNKKTKLILFGVLFIESALLVVIGVFYLLGYRLLPNTNVNINWDAISSVTSWVLPTMISCIAIVITLYTTQKQNNIALLSAKDSIYDELNKLSLFYTQYRISFNPLRKSKNLSSVNLAKEDDILRRAKLLCSDGLIQTVEKLKEVSVKIGILNLEAELYFDKLLELKKNNVYDQLKEIIENLENYRSDKVDMDKFMDICANNTLRLKDSYKETNYYSIWKEITPLQSELAKTYVKFVRELDNDYKI